MRGPIAIGAGCVVALAAVVAASALASPVPTSADDPAALQSELVTTGLYLVRGGGANTLLRFSANGIVMVDAKAPGEFKPLMAQVRRVSRIADLPVRALLLTGGDAAEAGNVADFEARGVRVVAAQAVVARLPALAASNVAPRIAFERTHELRLGGVPLQLREVGDGAASGATVVLFPDLRIVALGDLLPAGDAAPSAAQKAALGRVLALDFDRAVPAQGAILSRREVEAIAARTP